MQQVWSLDDQRADAPCDNAFSHGNDGAHILFAYHRLLSLRCPFAKMLFSTPVELLLIATPYAMQGSVAKLDVSTYNTRVAGGVAFTTYMQAQV